MAVLISLFSVQQVREKTARYDVCKKIQTPQEARDAIIAVLNLEHAAEERFCMFSLSTKNDIIGAHLISMGSLDIAVVHPREVYKAALLNNAASIICFHNHPSGNPEPSATDIVLTKRLAEVGEMIGIGLLDHVIIGHDGRFVSLKEMGVI